MDKPFREGVRDGKGGGGGGVRVVKSRDGPEEEVMFY